MKKMNALMGAKARITTLETALRCKEEQLASTEDARFLYAKKAEILTKGTEALRQGIVELRDVINEQAGQIDRAHTDMGQLRNRLRETKSTLVNTRIFAVGISLLLVAEIIMKVMGA